MAKIKYKVTLQPKELKNPLGTLLKKNIENMAAEMKKNFNDALKKMK